MSMRLVFEEEPDESYIRDGFVPATTDRLRFAGAEGWTRKTEEVELASGFNK